MQDDKTPFRMLAALALALALAAPAAAQTTRHYDASGHYLGRTERQGGTQRHYGPAGQFYGRSATPPPERRQAGRRDRPEERGTSRR